MIRAHRGSGKPYDDFQAGTGIDLSDVHDEPLTPEALARFRERGSLVQWDSETVLPDGTVLRSAKGCTGISTPLHEDRKGWNP